MADGTLRIELQTGLAAGPIEGVLVLHPLKEQPPQPHNDFETLMARDLPNIDLLLASDGEGNGSVKQRAGRK